MNRWTIVCALAIGLSLSCEKKPSEDTKTLANAASARPTAAPVTSATPSTGGLSPAERQEFYHLPEGGELIPLDLMRAVENVNTFKPFMEDLERYRMIADPSDPDGLPVGMSAAVADGKRVEPRMVFFNCAACHTSEITYNGKSIRVDGAPAHFDAAGLIAELLLSIDNTVTDPKKLSAFLTRLAKLRSGGEGLTKAYPDLKLPSDKPEGALLDKVSSLVKQEKAKVASGLEMKKAKLESAADALNLLKEKSAYLQRLRGLRTTTFAGPGRLDAFMAARNLLLGAKFAVDVNSPVSLPPVFGMSKLSWYHYDNNTTSAVQRNIGETLGMGSAANLETGESTVQIKNLLRLEELASKLPAPKWPEDMLGKLDAARVARGEPIYKKECASCHDPNADGTFPDRTFDLATIGTDPNRAQNFAQPIGDRPFYEVLATSIDKVQKKAFEREGITPEQAAKIAARKVEWRAPNKYSSRPLAGVWATAPYLHNGSVPTMYDLLLPPERRPKTFLTGSREYDPKKMGYLTDGSHAGTFLFNTALDANHNTGHTYGTTLSEEARMDLLEYLKSL